ncbi:head-tail joining protein [Roseomonas sp. USHLN139]|uniref:head-tail joining protein n=1 Tax=Roseomonas sp. USHLN139 TaxID=3081298 RepID=UPI003B0114EA
MDIDALNASVLGGFADSKPVTIRRKYTLPVTVPAVYDRFQVQVEVDGGIPVSTDRAFLQVRQGDAAFPVGFEPAAGDAVDVPARHGMPAMTFVVKDAQPDGLGWIILDLGFERLFE